jgi:glutathione S-transferase
MAVAAPAPAPRLPKYKFSYFNTQGLPEPIRYMFVLADEPFIDNRIDRDENWESFQSGLLWEKLPILEIEGGTIVSQTWTIARFLARRFGLVGKNEEEASKCDEIIDVLIDFRTEWVAWYYASETARVEIMDQLLKVHVPKCFKQLDKIVKKNVNGSGWIVGESVTWADIYIAYFFISFHENTKTPVLNVYKHLQRLKNQVFEFPAIAEYFKAQTLTRPNLA